jgi:hypothetical protein
MSELRLEGRLGVELIQPLRGCCVDSILAWRPQVIGEKHKCLFCDNPMKTVRAGEAAPPEWTGMLNETHMDREAPEFSVAELWFSEKRFDDPTVVERWCDERGMSDASVVKTDGMAYKVSLGEIVQDTDRAVWAAPGVIALIGLAKMDTGSLATGGMLHPLQQGGGKKEDEEENKRAKQGRRGAGPGKGKMDGSGVGQGGRGECLGKVMENFEKSLHQIMS